VEVVFSVVVGLLELETGAGAVFLWPPLPFSTESHHVSFCIGKYNISNLGQTDKKSVQQDVHIKVVLLVKAALQHTVYLDIYINNEIIVI